MTTNTPLFGNAGLVYGIGAYGTQQGIGVDADGNLTILDAAGNVLKTFADLESHTVKKAVALSPGAGVKLSVKNPFNAPAFVERAIVDVVTAHSSASAFSLDKGTTPTDASGAGLVLDAVPLGTAGVYDNLLLNGASQVTLKLGATEFINGKASASTGSGIGADPLVANVYLTFRKA
ncbi:hypothetical protein EON79_17600 [bacterium]|nr:MAG: hypothetical protein EON79_17600 [bacterium]